MNVPVLPNIISHWQEESGCITALFFAFLAMIFFSVEALLIRYLDIKAGIPGNVTAFCYLFFEGCIGTVGLVLYSLFGSGIFDIGFEHFFWVVAAGVLTTIGLVLQDYALSIGIAGVTYSIVNVSCVFQTVIGQVLLAQQVSFAQLVGIIICVVGACCMALSE